MDAQQFKDIRYKLGLTQLETGLALRLTAAERSVRRYEGGGTIPGPIQVAMRLYAKHGLDKIARADIAAADLPA